MSHSDSIKALPTNGVKLASTHDVNLLLTKLKAKLLMQFNIILRFFILPMDRKCWKTFSKMASSSQMRMVAELKGKIAEMIK
jgi:hypothetical protein